MEKNFIEKVTNLEREKIKYVPVSFLNEALDTLWNNLDDHNDMEENEIDSYINELKAKANAESKELYAIDDNDKKPDISICPYCGGKMILSFCTGDRGVAAYSRNRIKIREGDGIQYKCCYCGSTGPNVFLRVSLLDENEVKKDIQMEIEAAIDEIKREEEGDYDD